MQFDRVSFLAVYSTYILQKGERVKLAEPPAEMGHLPCQIDVKFDTNLTQI